MYDDLDWWMGKPPRKYSPDQPRDEHGRWVDVGGGDAGSEALSADRRMNADDLDETYRQLYYRYEVGLVSAPVAKAAVAKDIATQLRGDPDFKEAAWKFVGKEFYDRADFDAAWASTTTLADDAWSSARPQLSTELRDALGNSYPTEFDRLTVGEGAARIAASTMIQQWAESSGDAHPRSIAMQQAVQAEFGGGGTLAHLDPYDVQRAAAAFDAAQPGLRAFVRAQYAATQSDLAAHGIKEVPLYRGMTFGEYGSRDSPPGGIQADGLPHTAEVTQQPASSWTYDKSTAMSFGSMDYERVNVKTGMVVAAVVPAARVLSTPATGWGCKKEREMVVLAAPPDAPPDTVRYLAVPADDAASFGFNTLEDHVSDLLTPDAGKEAGNNAAP